MPLCSQVGGLITLAKVPAIGKGLPAADHRQVDIHSAADHFRHGAAIAICVENTERHPTAHRSQPLQFGS